MSIYHKKGKASIRRQEHHKAPSNQFQILEQTNGHRHLQWLTYAHNAVWVSIEHRLQLDEDSEWRTVEVSCVMMNESPQELSNSQKREIQFTGEKQWQTVVHGGGNQSQLTYANECIIERKVPPTPLQRLSRKKRYTAALVQHKPIGRRKDKYCITGPQRVIVNQLYHHNG